jgi:hypothetical protein
MTHIHRSQSTSAPHSRRPRAPYHSHSTGDADVPWRHVVQTYTWVADDELIKGRKHGQKTENWVKEQQQYFNPKTGTYPDPPPRPAKVRREDWEDLIHVYGVEADLWIRQEERARRVTQEREKARVRIQNELRRIEARLQQKREAEKKEREEARRKAAAEVREKEARDRAKLEKLILKAWANYESRWSTLASSKEELDFKRIPWPVIVPPRNPADITRDAIVALLFSNLHSQTQTRKERIRAAQLRWHPDRFRRFLGRVSESDKAAVEEGVGIIARCLNELK